MTNMLHWGAMIVYFLFMKRAHFTLYRSWKMNSMIRCVSWHPKGRLLAIGSNDNVQLLDMQSAQIMKPVLLDHGARGVGWNYTGELLGVADLDGIVWVLQKDGKILRSITKENSNSYFSLDWQSFEEYPGNRWG